MVRAAQKIQTAQDMLDEGFVFHTMSEQVSIVTMAKLEKLSTGLRTDVELDPDILGKWIPLYNDVDGRLIIDEFTTADPDMPPALRIPTTEGDWRPAGLIDAASGGIRVRYAENGMTDDISNSSILSKIEVSTLGQVIPRTVNEFVREETLRGVWDSTVASAKTSLDTLVGRLLGRDMLFWGPWGSGKSQIMKDNARWNPGHRWVITYANGDACEIGCHPYQLLDEDLLNSEKYGACERCVLEYDPDFKNTGVHAELSPGKITVIKQKYGYGMGIEELDGTEDVTVSNLLGTKLPNFSGEGNSDDPYHGVVFGKYVLANRGFLMVDEVENIRRPVVRSLVGVQQKRHASLRNVARPVPADTFFVGTANDISKIDEAFNDRTLLLHFEYATDMEDRKKIAGIALYGDRNEGYNIEIESIDGVEHVPLENTPLTEIQEDAINRFYLKVQHDKPEELSHLPEHKEGWRTFKDGASATRAFYLIDTLLNPERSLHITTEDIIYGLSYGFKTRIKADFSDAAEKERKSTEYVANTFPALLEEESKVWWCKAQNRIGVIARRAPEVQINFDQELEMYQNDNSSIGTVFREFKAAEDDNVKFDDLSVNYPFMAHLSREQRHFYSLDSKTAQALVEEYLQLKTI